MLDRRLIGDQWQSSVDGGLTWTQEFLLGCEAGAWPKECEVPCGWSERDALI